MLMLPLPFFFAFALGLFLLHEIASGRAATPARQGFLWLVGLCALHALLIGVYWGYGIAAVKPMLPVTASLLPMMAWLSFRLLSKPQSAPELGQILPRLLPTLAILFTQALMPHLIDLMLALIFFGYGIALWRMSGEGPDALIGTPLQQSVGLNRAMRLAALTLWSSVLVDVAILADYILAQGVHVADLLSLLSAAVLFALGALAVFSSKATGDVDAGLELDCLQQAEVATANHPETARRVDAFLRESRFYVQPDLTLIRIARRLALPEREVSTAINRHCGMNVSQYVNGFRLNEACRLLVETDLSITEVHLQAGFQTKSNFNREFRRQYGQSPREWRALHRTAAAETKV